jgi:hypothetical protein
MKYLALWSLLSGQTPFDLFHGGCHNFSRRPPHPHLSVSPDLTGKTGLGRAIAVAAMTLAGLLLMLAASSAHAGGIRGGAVNFGHYARQ